MSACAGGAFASAAAARWRRNPSSVSPMPPTAPTWRNERRDGRRKCAVMSVSSKKPGVWARPGAGGGGRQAGRRPMRDRGPRGEAASLAQIKRSDGGESNKKRAHERWNLVYV